MRLNNPVVVYSHYRLGHSYTVIEFSAPDGFEAVGNAQTPVLAVSP